MSASCLRELTRTYLSITLSTASSSQREESLTQGLLLGRTLPTTLTPQFHSVVSSVGGLTDTPSGVHTLEVGALRTGP